MSVREDAEPLAGTSSQSPGAARAGALEKHLKQTAWQRTSTSSEPDEHSYMMNNKYCSRSITGSCALGTSCSGGR